MLLLDEEIAEGTTIHVRVREDGSALEFDVVPPAQLAPVDHAIGVEA
jgi:hypothetical protein